ncbi:MAG TPA: helix-turn-helix transcriptional regulator [Acidimicrobiales bacterium]|nr:helix-turn-helix transcriptional regulator [Acidimicrobiales bacterium]
MTAAAPAAALDQARSALVAQDWAAAHAAATAVVAASDEPSGDALDVLAEAAWWIGRLDECIDARERAYAAYERAGADRSAGGCAVQLYFAWALNGKPAIATGWLRRARRWLDGDMECVEYGFLLLYEAEVAHGGGELARASDLAGMALDLGRRLRSPDLEAQALQAMARVLIDRGEPADGLAHLDEAMLFAREGRLSPLVAGRVYCSLVTACHELGDIRRARDWTDAVSSWADAHPRSAFPGMCRLHRAELLQWRGEWAAAEAEARRAGDDLAGVHVPTAAAAHVEVGEIRRRLGDLDGAEAAFARAEELNASPAAGRALLRLAQGRLEAADAIIAGALAAATVALGRAWLLPAEVQIAVALGDLDRAERAARELAATATHYESPILLAAAETARGRVGLAAGDAEAVATLRGAVQQWADLDVPYEAATTRVLLAQACRGAGDEEGAKASLAAAAAIFDRLGAVVDLATDGGDGKGGSPAGLTGREVEVLRLVAAGNTNKQIAAALYVSDKTVARHLSNIFAKVGVSTRAAATAFAFEHGLVGR